MLSENPLNIDPLPINIKTGIRTIPRAIDIRRVGSDKITLTSFLKKETIKVFSLILFCILIFLLREIPSSKLKDTAFL